MTSAERGEIFAAYRALARRVNARNTVAPPSTENGIRLWSPRTAILEGHNKTIVYNWDQDRLWTLPADLRGLLVWLRDERRPITPSDVANYLHRTTNTSLSILPSVTEAILSSLTRMAILNSWQQASASKRQRIRRAPKSSPLHPQEPLPIPARLKKGIKTTISASDAVDGSFTGT